MTSAEVAELAGVTYRQLDYWCRTGLLGEDLQRPTGSGYPRRFLPDDIRAVAALGLLARALPLTKTKRPIFERVAAAARAQSSAAISVEVADGVTLTLAPGAVIIGRGPWPPWIG